MEDLEELAFSSYLLMISDFVEYNGGDFPFSTGDTNNLEFILFQAADADVFIFYFIYIGSQLSLLCTLYTGYCKFCAREIIFQ